jgi:hypothetical protein
MGHGQYRKREYLSAGVFPDLPHSLITYTTRRAGGIGMPPGWYQSYAQVPEGGQPWTHGVSPARGAAGPAAVACSRGGIRPLATGGYSQLAGSATLLRVSPPEAVVYLKGITRFRLRRRRDGAAEKQATGQKSEPARPAAVERGEVVYFPQMTWWSRWRVAKSGTSPYLKSPAPPLTENHHGRWLTTQYPVRNPSAVFLASPPFVEIAAPAPGLA